MSKVDLQLEHGVGRALAEGDAGGVVEDGGDLGVNFDELVGLGRNLLVPCVDLGLDPLLEVTGCEGGEDVHDPLLRESGAFFHLRGKEGLEVWALVDVLVDLLEAEALVLGDVAVGDLVLLEVLLPAADDVLQEV